MSRKKKKNRKREFTREGSVFYMTSEEATLAQMPQYNAYATGYGAHGKKGYDRNAEKKRFRKEMGLD